MTTRKSTWLGLLAIASSLLMNSVASAQTADWPMLRGLSDRTGTNTDLGPGAANLRWFAPSSTDSRYTTTLTIDNAQAAANGNSFSIVAGNGPWYPNPLQASTVNIDASGPYLVNDPTTGNPLNPAYLYAPCVASSTTDPTVAQSPAVASTASWVFTPASAVSNLYALYVWIPVGNQQVTTGPGVHGTTGWQRYFVYTISAGGKQVTDIVDTNLSGGGWVRLGNGGAATNMVYPGDSANPITISLYNTVPRDSSGKLTEPVSTSPSTTYVVYADAAQAVPTNGYYDASPVSAQLFSNGALQGTQSTRTVAAENQLSSGGVGTKTFTTVATGKVTSYQYDTGVPAWIYSPVEDGSFPVATPFTAANANPFASWTLDANTTTGYTTPVNTVSAGATTVIPYTVQEIYQPSLNTGTYQIYAYVPGNDATHSFGKGVQYVVQEGLTQTPISVNQSASGGWVLISPKRFTNTSTAPLTLLVTNSSNDATDGGKLVYADAVRFVGEKNSTISSTPVIATVNIKQTDGTLAQTQVVVVADENGYIHCLDATGNVDGTTNEYWSYPSTVPTGGTDPNATADAGSEMPQGFNLSSALVTQVGSNYYLYIGSTNGRVYCIDMAGRGDFVLASHTIGSTARVWTYPASPGVTNSNLGPFRGSVTYGTPNNVPTLYVPTTQGRIYALNAVGSVSTHTTNVIWQYPAANKPTLGEIWTTPAFATFNGNSYLYFGTRQNSADDTNGAFYCFNVNTAASAAGPVWSYAGGTITDAISQTSMTVNTGDFLSAPAVVNQHTINATYPSNDGVVYAMNQNNYLYAFDALTGGLLWNPTNEINAGALGGLSVAPMTVYGTDQLLHSNIPVVMVPTLNGQFYGVFADWGTNNLDGTRQAWIYYTPSSEIASNVAFSNNWMFGNDESGFLYAFNNGTGLLNGFGNPPGESGITENNPAGDIFRHAKMRLVTQAGYNQLRQPTGSNPSYTSAVLNPSISFVRSPLAFEWGETVYIMVYDFPYVNTNSGGTTVPPPVVNLTLSSQGKTVRTISVEARQFTEPPNAPDNGAYRDNGYAILSFPFQAGGQQSLPPGNGVISISISTSSLNNFGAQQIISTAQTSTGANPSRIPFFIANPIALSMPDANNLPGNDNYSIGLSVKPSDPENLVNGSPAITGLTKDTSRLGTSGGVANHGTSVTAPMYVYDRSMMGLLRPDGTGLDGLRMDVKNLSWQGGRLAIWKHLDTSYYVNFEDYPDNFPNNSLDYPDIQTEQIQVIKDPNGQAQNPRYNPVFLTPPLVKDPLTGVTRPLQLGDTPESRVLQPTLFNLVINVPRFQPANTNSQVNAGGSVVLNSAGQALPQGYFGRVRAFVDSNQNGLLDGVPEEAYRGFNLMTSVDIDEKLTVSTPTVALGTLASGAGYDPLRPGSNYNSSSSATNGAGIFEPWSGNYSSMFQPLVASNEGNVNLINVRLAKAYQTATGTTFTIPANPQPWSIFASGNDGLAWLDGSVDTWSDLDSIFAPEGGGPNRPIAVQKSRVTDVTPNQLVANPVRRANPNLGTTGTFTPSGQSTPLPDVLNPALVGSTGAYALKYPPVSPRVGVSIPIGMPVGSYSQVMRLIEKNSNNEIWQMFNGAPETYSDPTFTLTFTVRESQITSTSTANTSTMLDSLALPNAANPLSYSSIQPAMVRDPFGSLIVAFASDRPAWAPSQPTATNQLGSFTLFLGTLGNSATFGKFGITNTIDPLSPLSDLNSFTPASNNQWFNQAVANYPSQSADLLFNSASGENVIAGTVQYGNPSFPNAGLANPFNSSSTFQAMYLGFTGYAQKQTPSGRLGESALFITTVSPSAGGGLSAPPQPVAMLNDPLVLKGKPSVLQTSKGADVFYPGTSGSESNVFYSYFDGSAFHPSVALPFGAGFASVTGVSASGRVYTGAGSFRSDGVTPILKSGDNIAELTFTGQLQGRPNPEVFLGRVKLDPTTYAVVDDTGTAIDNASTDGNVFLDLGQQSNELAQSTSQFGVFRTLGIQWDPTAPIQVTQTLNGVNTDLVVPGSQVYDRQTGIISFDTRLGGKGYVDTALGTVRFGSAVPNATAQIFVTYTPRFLRISAGGGAGYNKPVGLFDHREISNVGYWRRPGGSFADFTDDITSDRFVFTYNRGSGGAGAPPRPYITTNRLGIQLPYRIATDSNGNPVSVQVTGLKRAISAYQIDPANGRIYFTGLDEDNSVTVIYAALHEDGTTIPYSTPSPISVSLIQEVSEQPILISNAVNESDVTAFLDPFSYVNGGSRRPPLMWLFWTSSRSGTPNIFFETIAPQWSPVPIGQ